MREFFYPKTIAVIGVSNKDDNLAKNIISNLIEFAYKGVVYEVGRSGGVLHGRRIYKSILEVPEQVDLAVILTPAKVVPKMLKECGQKKIKHVIIQSAGFREYSEEGSCIEKEILKIAKRYKIKLIGPNCIGAMNISNGLALSFTGFKNIFRKGGVSIITQSGGVGISYLNVLASENLGLAKFVSIGNKLLLDENDFLEYLIKDPETEIICLYLEGISDGKRLMKIARKSKKPILLHKSNIGKEAKSIANSHTAALSSDDVVVSAALKQVGIARFSEPQTLVNYLKILPLPRLTGNKLAIISRSGGHAVIAADACEETGFTLSPFEDDFIKEIETHFRANVIRLTNPLDLGDLFDYQVYSKIVERTISQSNVDGVVFLHTYISSTEGESSRSLFDELERISFAHKKPIAICLATDDNELSRLKHKLSQPVFNYPSDAIRAMALARDFCYDQRVKESKIGKSHVEKRRVESIIKKCIKEKRNPLLKESLDILSNYGIPISRSVKAANEDEAVKIAKKIGYPVTLKIISPNISHKSDFGGVQLNLRNEESLRQAFEDIIRDVKKYVPDAIIEGILVQPMVQMGRDLIIGAKRDPNFGPAVMIGLGGIFVEIFKDTSLRILPIGDKEIEDMFKKLKGYPILAGARGAKPYDLLCAKEAVQKLGQLITDIPQIKEIDINPFRILAEGEEGFSLDARIILTENN